MKIINGLTHWCTVSLCLAVCVGCGTISKVAAQNHPVIGPGDAVPEMATTEVRPVADAIPPKTQISDLVVQEQFLPPIDPAKFVAAPALTPAVAPDSASSVQWHSKAAQSGEKTCLPVVPPDPKFADTNVLTATESNTPETATEISNCERRIQELEAKYATQQDQFDKQVAELHRQMEQQTETIRMLTEAKLRAEARFEQLQLSVDHYRKEAIRLETLMETQHSSDLVILDELSTQLQKLLEEPQ